MYANGNGTPAATEYHYKTRGHLARGSAEIESGKPKETGQPRARPLEMPRAAPLIAPDGGSMASDHHRPHTLGKKKEVLLNLKQRAPRHGALMHGTTAVF